MTYTASVSSDMNNGELTSGGGVTTGGYSTPETPAKYGHTKPSITSTKAVVEPVSLGNDDNIEVSSTGGGQESAQQDRAACKPEIGQLLADPDAAWHDLIAMDPEFSSTRLSQSTARYGMLLDPGAEAYGGDPEGWGVLGKIGKKLAKAAGGIWDILDDVPGVLTGAAKSAINAGLDVVTKHGLTMVKLAAGKLVPLALHAIGGPVAVAAYERLSTTTKHFYNEWQKREDKANRKPSKAKVNAVLAQLDKMESGQEAMPENMASVMTVLDNAAATAEAAAEPETLAEAIIGTDDRVQINDTEAEPWRRICALRITFATGATYRGTGFITGPRSVVTAGHCVYLESQGGWADTVEVIPGADGDESPFGSVIATDLRSVRGWVNDGKPASDFGCVILPHGSFSDADLGTFGYASLSANELVGTGAVVSGYPGDKPFGEAWSAGRAISSVTEEILRYDIDTFGGQSGAPVYVMKNGSRLVVGIHNYGGTNANSATRITADRYNRLNAWAQL